MADSIWAVLGIAPSTDERAIRSAYARALKAIDVDRDAAGFIALRSAYDAALAAARGSTGGASWLDSAPVPEREAPEAPATEATRTGDALPREIGELDALFGTAAGQGRRWLSAEEKLELRRCWAAIAAFADASDIETYGKVREAVSSLIVHWGALSVGLVPFAVEHFRWQEVEGNIYEDWAIGEILWRYRGVEFLRRVRRPGHSHHPAWLELTSKYYPGSSRGRVDPLLVHELQAVVRHVWPEVESEFDPGRVTLWANNTADPTHPENPHTRPQSRAAKIVGWLVAGYFLLHAGAALLGMIAGAYD